MKSIADYTMFNQVVVRTPYFPITKLHAWLKELDKSPNF